ncbi:MAG: selenide, water dikinase SelD [Chloroflexota bacterium]
MSDLAHVLRQLPRYDDPRLVLGDNPADDAGVYMLRDDLALVQTVDFFTPIVDDPFTYGQIAAANSLSDVYAVGGTPVTAMNIAAFPVKTLDLAVLGEILRGGAEKAREAGVTIVGGHTVDDDEPKFGLSVTGTVDPRQMITTRGARAGDIVVLTKPLGTGVIATALKAQAARADHLTQAVRWMTTLNLSASRAAIRAKAHAMTDITGYGLLGHVLDLCRASGVGCSLSASAIPLLPGAWDNALQGFIPGGTYTNLEHVRGDMHVSRGVDERIVDLLADPQTSGGLLVCLADDAVETFQAALAPDAIAATVGSIGSPLPGATIQLVE